MTEEAPRRVRRCYNCDEDLNGRGGMIEYVSEQDVECHCMSRERDPRNGMDTRGLRPCPSPYCNKGTPGERWGCEDCNFTMWVFPCGSCDGDGVYDLKQWTRCTGDERGQHDNSGAFL